MLSQKRANRKSTTFPMHNTFVGSVLSDVITSVFQRRVCDVFSYLKAKGIKLLTYFKYLSFDVVK